MMGKIFAPESEKTRKIREKLRKNLESQTRQITPEALKITVEKIHKWIADCSARKVRVQIPDKPLDLFTQNRAVAPLSKKVEQLARILQDSFQN